MHVKSILETYIINRYLNQVDKFILVAVTLVLVSCASSSTTVHTMGDTIDLTEFKGIIELNTDAISGEIKHNPLLRLNVEENIAKALRVKYSSMGSYSVFLMTASEAELKMNNHRALRDRGYTHLLIAAINPEIPRTSEISKSDNADAPSSSALSMIVSCTIYRLSDGMPLSLVNADVYRIDKDYWGRKATRETGTISKRWQLGPIYSCDQALNAVAN